MSRHSHEAYVPRARIDPIRNATDALAVLHHAVGGATDERTVLLLLDRQRRGTALVDITGTPRPETFVDIVSWATGAVCPVHACGLVVLTLRHGGVVDLDVDRWLEASSIADAHHLELVEWFVQGPDGIECPRDLLGEPERW